MGSQEWFRSAPSGYTPSPSGRINSSQMLLERERERARESERERERARESERERARERASERKRQRDRVRRLI